MSGIEFNTRLDQMSVMLNSFAYNLTKNMEDAKYLYQETAYRAITNREKFLPGTNFKAWMFTIMKNIFINNYRKASKRNTVADASNNLYLLNAGVGVAGNQAEKDFVMRDLNKAINRLDEEYRRPFIMHFHGYKYEEIAEEMRLPLGTVKSRIFFARKQMKDCLELKGFERY